MGLATQWRVDEAGGPALLGCIPQAGQGEHQLGLETAPVFDGNDYLQLGTCLTALCETRRKCAEEDGLGQEWGLLVLLNESC